MLLSFVDRAADDEIGWDLAKVLEGQIPVLALAEIPTRRGVQHLTDAQKLRPRVLRLVHWLAADATSTHAFDSGVVLGLSTMSRFIPAAT